MVSSTGTRHLSPAWRGSDHPLRHCHSLDRPSTVQTMQYRQSHMQTHTCAAHQSYRSLGLHTSSKPRRRRGCKAPNQRILDGVAPPVVDHLRLAVVAAAATVVISIHSISGNHQQLGLSPSPSNRQLPLASFVTGGSEAPSGFCRRGRIRNSLSCFGAAELSCACLIFSTRKQNCPGRLKSWSMLRQMVDCPGSIDIGCQGV